MWNLAKKCEKDICNLVNTSNVNIKLINSNVQILSKTCFSVLLSIENQLTKIKNE